MDDFVKSLVRQLHAVHWDWEQERDRVEIAVGFAIVEGVGLAPRQ